MALFSNYNSVIWVKHTLYAYNAVKLKIPLDVAFIHTDLKISLYVLIDMNILKTSCFLILRILELFTLRVCIFI